MQEQAKISAFGAVLSAQRTPYMFIEVGEESLVFRIVLFTPCSYLI